MALRMSSGAVLCLLAACASAVEQEHAQAKVRSEQPTSELKALQPYVAADDMPFAGSWRNPDRQSHGGMTRLAVFQDDRGWRLEAWALSGESEVSIGAAPLRLLGDYTVCTKCVAPMDPSDGDPASEVCELPRAANAPPVRYGFAHLDHGFCNVYLTLRMSSGKLVVEDYNLFTDRSGRPDFRNRYEMFREELDPDGVPKKTTGGNGSRSKIAKEG